MKYCPKCERKRNNSKFSNKSSAADGLQGWCKDCMNEYSRDRRKLKKMVLVECSSCKQAFYNDDIVNGKCVVCIEIDGINKAKAACQKLAKAAFKVKMPQLPTPKPTLFQRIIKCLIR